MPVYVFRCQGCGRAIERRLDRPESGVGACPDCQGELKKDFRASLPRSPFCKGQTRCETKRFSSRAYGCHPKQVDVFNRKFGRCGAHWRRQDGAAVFEDVRAMERYEKAYGHDKLAEAAEAEKAAESAIIMDIKTQ